MKGVSNVVSAIFVLAVILTAAYTIISAYITHTTELTIRANQALEREIHAAHIGYSIGECNTVSGILEINYIGIDEELSVRILCVDLKDTINSICIVPFVANNAKSAQYVDRFFPGTLDLNILKCSSASALVAACQRNELMCYAIGAYTVQRIPVEKVA